MSTTGRKEIKPCNEALTLCCNTVLEYFQPAWSSLVMCETLIYLHLDFVLVSVHINTNLVHITFPLKTGRLQC